MQPIEYRGWEHCYRLSNGHVDLVVTADVGPRIIHFGFPGGENEFKVFEQDAGRTGGPQWRPYGGHRLWYAPEDQSGHYLPDNDPVEVAAIESGLRVVQPIEPGAGIRKQMQIQLAPAEPGARVIHRLTNESGRPLELAAWALSVMAPGGVAVLPLPPRGTHPANLLPTESLALWPYTDLSDRRCRLGRESVLLRQESDGPPQKIGLRGSMGWVGYARSGHLFVKRFTPTPNQPHADFGCAVEAFTNAEMLEVETLGPLVTLAPGQSTVHTEYWSLLRDVPPPADGDAFGAIQARVAQLAAASEVT